MSSVEIMIVLDGGLSSFTVWGLYFSWGQSPPPAEDSHVANRAVSTEHTDEGRFGVLKEGWGWVRAGYDSGSEQLWVIACLTPSLLLGPFRNVSYAKPEA